MTTAISLSDLLSAIDATRVHHVDACAVADLLEELGHDIRSGCDRGPTLAQRVAGFAFFWTHAGWSHRPALETAEQGRARCCLELLEAEEWADMVELEYEWGHCDSDDGEPAHYCFVRYRDAVASLSGIDCTDCGRDPCCRVVQAELAVQLLEQLYCEVDCPDMGTCDGCGEALGADCQGDPHCPDCDGPCPCCTDTDH